MPAKLPSFICFEEDSDGGPKNTGAVGTRPRGALAQVLSHGISDLGPARADPVTRYAARSAAIREDAGG